MLATLLLAAMAASTQPAQPTCVAPDGTVIELELAARGRWYLRFIHLARLGDSEFWYSKLLVWLGVEPQRIPYESRWATLTFEIR